MTTETGFPGLSPHDAQNPQKVSSVVSRMNNGKLNCTGTVTLAASAATTTVTDARVGKDSVIGFMAKTDNAITAAGAGMGVKTITPGVSFIITHNNTADADKTFGYSVLG